MTGMFFSTVYYIRKKNTYLFKQMLSSKKVGKSTRTRHQFYRKIYLTIPIRYLRGTFFKNRTKSKIEKKKFSIFIFLILFSDSLYLN